MKVRNTHNELGPVAKGCREMELCPLHKAHDASRLLLSAVCGGALLPPRSLSACERNAPIHQRIQ